MRSRKRKKYWKKAKKQTLSFYPTEVFKEISLGADSDKLKLFYAISNFGRLVSFTNEINEGRFVNGNKQDGYRIWRYTVRGGNNKLRYKHRFLYRLVAEYFIPKTSEEQVFVLHLDRDRANDHVDNLRWATKGEMVEHSKKSPFVLAAREKQRLEPRERKIVGKLTEKQVKRIKKKLLDPDRKTPLKTLAKYYGVTTMQLHRIKSGENWGHLQVKLTDKPKKQVKSCLHLCDLALGMPVPPRKKNQRIMSYNIKSPKKQAKNSLELTVLH